MGAPPTAPAHEPLELAGAETAAGPDGLATAAHYGDPAGEYRRLVEGCGLVDRPWAEHLELRGEDRARFLHGLVTCEVKTLAAGDARFGFFTSAQGRVLAEARIAALAEGLLLELPAGCAAPIAEHLARYLVADRVEIVPRGEVRAFDLVGPAAGGVAARLGPEVATLGDPATPRWAHARVEWRGRAVVVGREERRGAPALTVRLAGPEARELAAELVGPGDGPAAAAVGFEAAEALRVEAGLARFGPDFGSEQFPQEVGADEALDFDKGCFLGQEVVARIHYRGKVNHRLCGLRLASDERPAPGSAIRLESDEVGSSGTAVRSPRHGAIALAVVHRRAVAGARVSVAGVAAELVELPFAGA